MALSRIARNRMLARFAQGPAAVKRALARIPPEARKWRPGPGTWSAHEVVWHCADAERNTAARIRYLAAEDAPLIVSYDEAAWALKLDYHRLPLAPALAEMTLVRANTLILLRQLPEAAWRKEGFHTKHGRFTPEDWLRYYSEHLQMHARQILRNLAAWKARVP